MNVGSARENIAEILLDIAPSMGRGYNGDRTYSVEVLRRIDDLNIALDHLITAVRAEMPCYSDGPDGGLYDDCPSCTARKEVVVKV